MEEDGIGEAVPDLDELDPLLETPILEMAEVDAEKSAKLTSEKFSDKFKKAMEECGYAEEDAHVFAALDVAAGSGSGGSSDDDAFNLLFEKWASEFQIAVDIFNKRAELLADGETAALAKACGQLAFV